MGQKLTGKSALVLGGAGRIGQAAVQCFVDEGAQVVVADIDDSHKEILSSKFGQEVLFRHCDVTQEEQVALSVNQTVDAFGQLDILVNCAGIADGGSILDSTKEDFDKVLNSTIYGTFYSIKHAAKSMMINQGGSIISSGRLVSPDDGHAYTCSKAATSMLCSSSATELGYHNIRVNMIEPGWATIPPFNQAEKNKREPEPSEQSATMPTPSSLLGRPVDPLEVAQAILWLASEDSSFVTGQTLHVDGGQGGYQRSLRFLNQLTNVDTSDAQLIRNTLLSSIAKLE